MHVWGGCTYRRKRPQTPQPEGAGFRRWQRCARVHAAARGIRERAIAKWVRALTFWETRLSQRIFRTWRALGPALAAVASDCREDMLKYRALKAWRKSMRALATGAAMAREHSSHRRRCSAFALWRLRAREARAERANHARARQAWALRRLRHGLRALRENSEQRRLRMGAASVHHGRHQRRRVLQAWRSEAARLQALAQHAEELGALADARVAGWAVHAWRRACRRRKWMREALEAAAARWMQHTAAAALTSWRQAARASASRRQSAQVRVLRRCLCGLVCERNDERPAGVPRCRMHA